MDDQQRARELLALGLDEYGHHVEAANVRKGIDLDVYSIELWSITAALRAAPEGFVLVRKEAIDWLNGETEEGFECPPDRYFRDEPPRYWWRSVFREKAGLAARPQGVKDAG